MDSLGLFNQEKRKRKRKKEKKKKYTAPREEVLYEEQAGIIGVRVESCMRKKRETKLSYSSLKKKKCSYQTGISSFGFSHEYMRNARNAGPPGRINKAIVLEVDSFIQ